MLRIKSQGEPSRSPMTRPSEETVYRAVSQTGISLGLNIQRSTVFASDQLQSDDCLEGLIEAAQRAGIHLREMEFAQLSDAQSFLREGYPVLVCHHDGDITLVDAGTGKRFETIRFGSGLRASVVSLPTLRQLLIDQPSDRVFVAKQELECDSLSATSQAHHDGHHEHPSPIRRFLALLKLEQRDIWMVALFALVSGVLTLATPLAVESLVNVVSWGVYLQPLVVLGLVLLVALSFAGILRILQKVTVEMIQRRQFVRIVGDLAHRFPRANQDALKGKFPREFANRIFDIMTIQKATSVLLLDGISIVLTTILGLVLLAFYHPFLLGFDIVLLISMISITWALGRGGIRTAIDESATKYQTVHWLQDVLATPSVFKIGGGEALAIDRANELTNAYLSARKEQFRVVLRQAAFAILLQVFASTAVLAIGGWLVIDGQLTLGQLVASELVVTVVVGAFAKAGKSLEKFYDLMAGVDKVGYLVDIPVDPRPESLATDEGPLKVAWSELEFHRIASRSTVPAMTILPGNSAALVGGDIDARTDIAKSLGGLMRPNNGIVRIGEYDPATIAGAQSQRVIGYAGANEIFAGTIRENIDLGRAGMGQKRVRDVLESVGLSDSITQLDRGLQTMLQTGGHPLSDEQLSRLTLARAMVSTPNVLVINRTLDRIAPDKLDTLWSSLTGPDAPWTLVVITEKDDIAARCDTRIDVRRNSTNEFTGDHQ